MEEELGGTFVVAVDELGLNGLWSTIKDVSVLLLHVSVCCTIRKHCSCWGMPCQQHWGLHTEAGLDCCSSQSLEHLLSLKLQ